ncbi:SSI family serine proteinase inhibitor [Streptomyces gobiensis]|uniref:SSI family serine proteinase inhibitor n=1 Tax=Streptomyces gobiensis TaxID=2875706 RepID=UPI001E4E02C3|nr:SSI family serine proteinase inhibitor [Streptomyces gobiensis]UGY92457.1 subtilase-type protease inhibitor [Streptomyces gobiensis]
MMRRIAATGIAVTAAFSIAATVPALGCPPPAGEHRLTITYKEDKDADEKEYVLRCKPTGGNHPDAQAACDAVDKAVKGPKNPWEPVPEDALCTQIYGGPQTARVTGVWNGQKIKSDFDRTNGCEIARWDTLVPALPKAE